MWFDYPIHRPDDSGLLTDAEAEGSGPAWQRAIKARQDPETKRQNQREEFIQAYDRMASDGQDLTVKDFVDDGWSESTVKRRLKEMTDVFEVIRTKGRKGGDGPSLIRKKANAERSVTNAKY